MSLMRQRINLDSHHPEDLQNLSWDDLLYSLSSGGYGSDVMGYDEDEEELDVYKGASEDEFEEYREVNAGFKEMLNEFKLEWKKRKGFESEHDKIDVRRLVKGKKKLFNAFRSDMIEAAGKLSENSMRKHVYTLAQENLLKIKKMEIQSKGKNLSPEMQKIKTSLTNIIKIMGVLSKVMEETDRTLAKYQSNPFTNTKSVMFYGDPDLLGGS